MWKVLAAVLAVIIIALIASGWAAQSRSRERVRPVREKLGSDWRQFKPRIDADFARWRDDPMLSWHDGGDAAPLLALHIRWEGRDAGLALEVPEALTDRLKRLDGGWAAPAPDIDTSSVDLTWMSRLDAFGYWDLESAPGPLQAAPFDLLHDPLPELGDAMNIGRVRLVQGLGKGDARSAAHEVRELARLCLSTETLLGGAVGVALLGMERRAYEEAARRRHDTSGWVPISEADQAALRRALFVAQAPYRLVAPPELIDADVAVGRCSALREGLGFAIWVRSYLRDELPEHYAGLGRALEHSGCRLRRARAAWANESAAVQLPIEGKELCRATGVAHDKCEGFPDSAMRLPFVKPIVGNIFAAASAPDDFKGYRPDAGS